MARLASRLRCWTNISVGLLLELCYLPLRANECVRMCVCACLCVCALVTFCYIAHTHCCILIKANRCAALKAYKNQLNQNTARQCSFSYSASQIKCNYSGQRDDGDYQINRKLARTRTVSGNQRHMRRMRNAKRLRWSVVLGWGGAGAAAASCAQLTTTAKRTICSVNARPGGLHHSLRHMQRGEAKCGRTLLASNYN